MNFYKHYIGDFQRDTGHLSLTERGAYLALIHHYYATEKPLPNNLDALCRIAGAVSAIERKAVKVAIDFFEVVDSGLMHSRIEAEIHKAGEQSNTNRNIALAREEKRRTEKLAKQQHENSTNRAESVPRNEHENSTNQTPDTRHHINQEQTHIEETNASVKPTLAASVCLAMKLHGVIDINPSHQTLLALLNAGATEAEFVQAAIQSKAGGKGFSYAVGIVKKQREEAAKLVLHQGVMPTNKNYAESITAAASSVFKDKYIKEQTQQPVEVEHESVKQIA